MNEILNNVASLRLFLPETILSLAILGILVVDLIAGKPDMMRSASIALGALGAALIGVIGTARPDTQGLFGGLMAHDPMGDFFKILFILTAILVGIQATRAKDAIDYNDSHESAEFYALILTTVLGMFLMATSTDLLTAFLSLEMVSIMSYILAGFKRRSRKSSEASLKYVIYGGVASGIMLFGMSLLYGLAGSTNFTVVRSACANATSTSTVVIAVILCLAGFGYKIASVPFHMWCPDVYEGAPTPVTAFLSVGPKAAGFALLLRFFAGLPTQVGTGLDSVTPWPLLLGIIACATMTLGNFAALGQSNLKRMFAYSSIAHAGYLLLGLCAGGDSGTRAILLYLVTYLFMNIGAFGVIMALADVGVGEEVLDYRGLSKRAPYAALVMAICLFSLTGLPPFAGFIGKFYLFYAVIEKGGTMMWTIGIIGVLNSAVSLFYYARILKAMYFEKAADETELVLPRVHTIIMGTMAVPTTLLMVAWSPLVSWVDRSLVQWLPSLAQFAQLP